MWIDAYVGYTCVWYESILGIYWHIVDTGYILILGINLILKCMFYFWLGHNNSKSQLEFIHVFLEIHMSKYVSKMKMDNDYSAARWWED